MFGGTNCVSALNSAADLLAGVKSWTGGTRDRCGESLTPSQLRGSRHAGGRGSNSCRPTNLLNTRQPGGAGSCATPPWAIRKRGDPRPAGELNPRRALHSSLATVQVDPSSVWLLLLRGASPSPSLLGGTLPPLGAPPLSLDPRALYATPSSGVLRQRTSPVGFLVGRTHRSCGQQRRSPCAKTVSSLLATILPTPGLPSSHRRRAPRRAAHPDHSAKTAAGYTLSSGAETSWPVQLSRWVSRSVRHCPAYLVLGASYRRGARYRRCRVRHAGAGQQLVEDGAEKTTATPGRLYGPLDGSTISTASGK